MRAIFWQAGLHYWLLLLLEASKSCVIARSNEAEFTSLSFWSSLQMETGRTGFHSVRVIDEHREWGCEGGCIRGCSVPQADSRRVGQTCSQVARVIKSQHQKEHFLKEGSFQHSLNTTAFMWALHVNTEFRMRRIWSVIQFSECGAFISLRETPALVHCKPHKCQPNPRSESFPCVCLRAQLFLLFFIYSTV